MSGWPVVYYRTEESAEPVREFIDGLEPKVQVVVDNQIGRLALFGPHLPFPHSSQADGSLRELRCHYGNRLFRILYRRSENLFVLLHAFEKRSSVVPAAEKAEARRRWEDFQERMNRHVRRPPRAAGHDAP